MTTAPFEEDEDEIPQRDDYGRALCPECGAVLSQVERADYCGCGYEVGYP